MAKHHHPGPQGWIARSQALLAMLGEPVNALGDEMLHLSADRLHPRLPKYFDPGGRGVQGGEGWQPKLISPRFPADCRQRGHRPVARSDVQADVAHVEYGGVCKQLSTDVEECDAWRTQQPFHPRREKQIDLTSVDIYGDHTCRLRRVHHEEGSVGVCRAGQGGQVVPQAGERRYMGHADSEAPVIDGVHDGPGWIRGVRGRHVPDIPAASTPRVDA